MSIYGNTVGTPMPQQSGGGVDLQEAVEEALKQAKESGEFDGPAGKDGQDGYTPVKGVDYFDGQPGKDGSDGKDGADGYTPVKGKDYFDGKDGQDGSPGKDGSNGVSATHSWNGTVLTVTSASGTSSADLKGEKGNPGKTAYAYAQDGGYTGTEEEFAEKLTQELPTKVSELENDSGYASRSELPRAFYVTFSDDSVDKTNAEIYEAYQAGKSLYLVLNNQEGIMIPCSYCDEHLAAFFGLYANIVFMVFDEDNAVDYVELPLAARDDIPTALRNPNALTINGVSYDGSEAVDMTIEGGGSGNSAPDYVRTEAERLAKVVQARQNENTISAILSSDYHLPNAAHVYHNQILESITHAGQAMGILRNQLSIDFEAKLGDLIWDSGETPEEALANFRLVHSLVSAGNILDRFEGNGNHDHLQSNSTPLTDSQVYANIGIYNKGCVRDSANRAGGYCYKDYEEYKLRVILLNTSEANDGSFTVSSAQVTWLGEALAVPVEEGWGTLILSHHPLDWGGSSTAVMNKIKGASGIVANLHGHVHTFTQDVITGTEIPRLAIPNVCFYRNNEYGTNGKAENSEGIEFGTTRTYSKTAKTANDTSFCVLTLDRAAGKLYLDRYGAGIDRVENVPTWGKKGYTNLVPTSEAADSTEPYNGTGYKNGVYLSSSGGDGEDSACVATGYIPYSWAKGNVLYVKGADVTTESHMRIYGYASKGATPASSACCSGPTIDANFTIEKLADKYYKLTHKLGAPIVTYLRLSLIGTGENLIVTVNEEID